MWGAVSSAVCVGQGFLCECVGGFDGCLGPLDPKAFWCVFPSFVCLFAELQLVRQLVAQLSVPACLCNVWVHGFDLAALLDGACRLLLWGACAVVQCYVLAPPRFALPGWASGLLGLYAGKVLRIVPQYAGKVLRIVPRALRFCDGESHVYPAYVSMHLGVVSVFVLGFGM